MISEFKGKYRFLSNFHPIKVEFEGDSYLSVEHAYQAAKTVDPLERLDIHVAPTAAEAKKRGKKVTLRPEWDDPKFRLATMKALLVQKFNDPDLREALLATYPQELVEGNWWGDVFWGMCRGKGENHLGKLLMEIRDDLKRNR